MLGPKILIPPWRDSAIEAFTCPAYRQAGLLSNSKDQTLEDKHVPKLL